MKFILSVFTLSLCLSISAQEKAPIPDYNFSIGGGVGPTYGVVGVKSVIGKKGSGLLLGLGRFNGMTSYQIGFQVCSEYLYINPTYGTVGQYEYIENGSIVTKSLSGVTLIVGGLINLNKSKRLYIDPGAGISTPFMFKNGSFLFGDLGFRAVLGIGYRFGGKMKN